ncbi:MAG: Polyhydroxyalkanoic acid synthase, partial [Rhizobacter sp.]|nr:Polyhydroxyalkanoic acid synthase [Rhizobacter sp.]
TYVYASKEDHIVPWDSAYLNTQVVGGESRFVLGASGHIAGVINPPSSKKRHHWVMPERGASGRGKAKGPLPATPAEWFAQAEQRPGSWWPDWMGWLHPLSGRQVAAPKRAGGAGFAPIEPAPGRYVKERA